MKYYNKKNILVGKVVKMGKEEEMVIGEDKWAYKYRKMLVETEETYPQTALFYATGKCVEKMRDINEGDRVRVLFNFQANNVGNGDDPWYINNLMPWAINKLNRE